MKDLNIQLRGIDSIEPPDWINESAPWIWYYVNEHGEQWVAGLVADEVLFAGLDNGWKTLRLNRKQIESALDFKTFTPGIRSFVLGDTILNAGEAFWAASVLYVAMTILGRA